jgi:mannose-1-phosphate guanylyltransferase/mannose-6-phosphate isomerase
MFSLSDFTISPDTSNIEALKKIDRNTKGFLLVTKNDYLLGTLSDGDIRRAFVKGKECSDTILGEYNTNYRSVTVNDDFTSIIEIFKQNNISFLPITTKMGVLINVITRRQMHSLLLQDNHVNLTYDFMNVDESLVEFEIFQRPWGFYKTTVMNEFFQSKIINIKPGGMLSLQMHKRREEHWIIVHGTGVAQVDDSELSVSDGSTLFIPKGCKHRVINTSESESLIITEVQLGDYFGEDDIIRFDDIYGRN